MPLVGCRREQAVPARPRSRAGSRRSGVATVGTPTSAASRYLIALLHSVNTLSRSSGARFTSTSGHDPGQLLPGHERQVGDTLAEARAASGGLDVADQQEPRPWRASRARAPARRHGLREVALVGRRAAQVREHDLAAPARRAATSAPAGERAPRQLDHLAARDVRQHVDVRTSSAARSAQRLGRHQHAVAAAERRPVARQPLAVERAVVGRSCRRAPRRRSPRRGRTPSRRCRTPPACRPRCAPRAGTSSTSGPYGTRCSTKSAYDGTAATRSTSPCRPSSARDAQRLRAARAGAGSGSGARRPGSRSRTARPCARGPPAAPCSAGPRRRRTAERTRQRGALQRDQALAQRRGQAPASASAAPGAARWSRAAPRGAARG